MSRQSRIAGTAGTPCSNGVVAGGVLRAIRDVIGSTQEQFAEALDVDPNTIKGWETGRRPLINASGRTIVSLRRKLLQLGAPGDLTLTLDTAMDADLFISHTLNEGDRGVLLSDWVATRPWSDLLAWVLADRTPEVISNHLRNPSRTALAPEDRRRFFGALRKAADAARGAQPAAMQLRRQVYYMTAWDPSPSGSDWLASIERTELRRIRRDDTWTPAWPLLRSIAVARSCQGDPTLLREFIDRHLNNDLCEAANLNYWSYWVEETPRTAVSDTFMAQDLTAGPGHFLLKHLTDGLEHQVPYLSLSIHAIRSLIERRPSLLMGSLQLARHLRTQAVKLLDDGADLTAQTRRELDNIQFAVKMAVGHANGSDHV